MSTGGEWSDSSKFALCTVLCHTFFPLGLMIMSGIAYFVRNWRYLQLVLFSPLVLVVALFYWSALFLSFFFFLVITGSIIKHIQLHDCGAAFHSGFSLSQPGGSSPRAGGTGPLRRSGRRPKSTEGRSLRSFSTRWLNRFCFLGKKHTKEWMTLTPNLLHSSLDTSWNCV